jgi:hypothetical protein
LGNHHRERTSGRDIGCAKSCGDEFEAKPSRRFLRRVILEALDIPPTDQVELAVPGQKDAAFDVSFSLDTDIHYRRCQNLLRELNPRALNDLARVHVRRTAAITGLRQAWQTPATRLLEGACSAESRTKHDATCNTRMLSTSAVRRQMQLLTLIMMDILAMAKSKHHRTSMIRAMLSPGFFNASFPSELEVVIEGQGKWTLRDLLQ